MSEFKNTAPYPGAPTLTRVSGYFNQFDYAFALSLTELNFNYTIGPREFLCYSVTRVDPTTGKQKIVKIKINDPRLAKYVGSNKLAVENSPVDVPIVWLPSPTPAVVATNAMEFSGSQQFKTDQYGRVINARELAETQALQMTSAPASASCIAGYSVEDAVKLGVIKRSINDRIKEDHEIPDKPARIMAELPPVPTGGAPKQPNQEPVVPPQLPPRQVIPATEYELVKLPATAPAKLNIAPQATVQAPPKMEAIAGVESQPAQLSDLMPDGQDSIDADLPEPIAEVDLSSLVRNVAAKSGIVQLPEPLVPTTATAPDEPKVAVVPAPEAEQRQRRTRRVQG